MDSITQAALGAAVGVAVMGRRTAVWKSAIWGAVCGTLPDLDSLVDHGDPVANMVMHRAHSHALPWLTLASLPIGWLIARANREAGLWRRWWLAAWLALVTHPLLDWMTVYGTQLLRPFTDHPYAIGSVFIIDPMYTVPLLVGVGVAIARSDARGLRWNAGGLAFATAYIAWSIGAQLHVRGLAERALAEQRIDARGVLVTPAAFSTVLWRIVATTPDAYHEGFHSLLDDRPRIVFDRFDRGAPLREALAGHAPLERMAAFSHGFFALSEHGREIRVSDLRMGQHPGFVFQFAIAHRDGERIEPLAAPQARGGRIDVGRVFDWWWRRLLGRPVDPPR